MLLYVVFLISLISATSFAAPREKRATGCSAITIVSRKSWGAPPKAYGSTIPPVNYVFIHHTIGSSCTTQTSCSTVVKGIYNYHTYNQKWSDIGYSFLIGGDGRVYEGRGWGKEGAHTYGWNFVSYAISFIGNYESRVPPAKMISAAKNLILCGISKGDIKSSYGLYGHRDGTCTGCPGNAFYNSLKSWANWHKHGKIKQYCSG
ncbi:peptidoglycan recognition protein 1 [Chamberlinius hualienensis]